MACGGGNLRLETIELLLGGAAHRVGAAQLDVERRFRALQRFFQSRRPAVGVGERAAQRIEHRFRSRRTHGAVERRLGQRRIIRRRRAQRIQRRRLLLESDARHLELRIGAVHVALGVDDDHRRDHREHPDGGPDEDANAFRALHRDFLEDVAEERRAADTAGSRETRHGARFRLGLRFYRGACDRRCRALRYECFFASAQRSLLDRRDGRRLFAIRNAARGVRLVGGRHRGPGGRLGSRRYDDGFVHCEGRPTRSKHDQIPMLERLRARRFSSR